MKHKTRLMLLTILSSVITVIFYFMTYRFNPKYVSTKTILYVGDYRKNNGHLFILLLFILLVVFSLLFIFHIIKDSKELEMFDQSGKPEFYSKDNLFTLPRLIEYTGILSAGFVLIRDGFRAFTYDELVMATYLFKTDVIFVMWDVSFLLFLLITTLLIIEYFISKKTIDY